MIDFTAFFKISYGLYIVSSGNETHGNGYISNTVFQVTSEPAQFSTCCNKDNFTASLIEKHQAFSVSILHTEAAPELYGTFGYKSGRDINKMEGITVKYGETGVPIVVDDTLAYIECNVVQTIDLGTHIMFIGKVVQSEVLSNQNEPLTYAYYRQVKNGVAPKNAPTYIDPAKLEQKETKTKSEARYQCILCGYVYDDADEPTPFEELPEDWTCPACGAEKTDFIKIK